MKSQTSIVAKQVRLQQWAEQVKDCQSRPKGTKVETWCDMNGLSKANYYYRLRCIREACLEQLQEQSSPEFVELSLPMPVKQEQTIPDKHSNNMKPVAILRTPNNVSVDLFPTATPDFLNALMKAINHAK